MLDIIADFQTIGFSGSRSVVDRSACQLAADRVAPGARVLVGCAVGVDLFFRSRFPHAEVFTADRSFGRGGFAARSIACVDAVAAAGGLWVSFPSGAAPAGLVPHRSASRCFYGSGSGSWASLAYAIGRSVPVLVFLGAIPVPSGWSLEAVGVSGWYAFQPAVMQLSLL